MLVHEKAIILEYQFNTNNFDKLIFSWQDFLKHNIWQKLIAGIPPKKSGCGLIYELPNFLNRPNESFAIVDMRNIKFAEPHYHPTGETEIYFVLCGTARIFVGGIENKVKSGDVIIIEPNKAHFTIPDKDFVIAAVNTPPFKPASYISLTKTDHSVGFDLEKFNQIIS